MITCCNVCNVLYLCSSIRALCSGLACGVSVGFFDNKLWYVDSGSNCCWLIRFNRLSGLELHPCGKTHVLKDLRGVHADN